VTIATQSTQNAFPNEDLEALVKTLPSTEIPDSQTFVEARINGSEFN
jgi:hypothetical protein